MPGRPRSRSVEPGSPGFGIDAGESARRNWKARNEPRWQSPPAVSECNRSGATATRCLVPVLPPRRVHVENQSARHHCSDLQLGQLPSEAFRQERGNRGQKSLSVTSSRTTRSSASTSSVGNHYQAYTVPRSVQKCSLPLTIVCHCDHHSTTAKHMIPAWKNC